MNHEAYYLEDCRKDFNILQLHVVTTDIELNELFVRVDSLINEVAISNVIEEDKLRYEV